jgi:adenine-specific DNA glycosylase
LNIQNQVPEPKKSIKKKKLYCSSVLLLKNNKDILLKKRTSKILNNQWDLPSSEWNNQEVDEITGLCLIENIKYKKSKDLYRHIFSHIDLKIRIYFGKIKSSKIEKNNKSYKWVSLNELDKYPTTLICRNILKNYKLI